MESIFGNKPKRSRSKKTIKEKLDALADKYLLNMVKNDPELLRIYINQREGLNIAPEPERKLQKIIEDTKLFVYEEIAHDLPRDPEITEAIRDKFIADLGLTSFPPRGRHNGGQSPRPSLKSHVEKLERDIAYVNKIKELLGTNNNGMSSILTNPDLIKALLEIFKVIMGSSGLTSDCSGVPAKSQVYAVIIDDKYVEMNQQEYEQYCLRRKAAQLPETNPATPLQEELKEKPAVNDDNAAGKTEGSI